MELGSALQWRAIRRRQLFRASQLSPIASSIARAQRSSTSANLRYYSQPVSRLPTRRFFDERTDCMTRKNSRAILLRDSCTCPACVDESTQQRKFNTHDIPEDIAIRHCTRDGSMINITWTNDIPGYSKLHRTVLSIKSLWALQGTPILNRVLRRRKYWNRRDFSPHEVAFGHYMNDEQKFSLAMRHLYTDGILFLTQVPNQDDTVKQIASRIGPLRNTFYGSTWDVVSQPNAKNVAYTSEKLDLHMDLLYMSKPPSFQLLHCKANSFTGGESQFVDTFAAAHVLKEKAPELYHRLTKGPMTFHYQNGPHHYLRRAPTLEVFSPKTMNALSSRLLEVQPEIAEAMFFLDDSDEKKRERKLREFVEDSHFNGYSTSEVKAVNWSPPFQGPLGCSSLILPVLVRALAAFRNAMKRPELTHERKMEPGTCVIFDNRRIAHGRSAFVVGDNGSRMLQGAYLDDDDFLSKCEDLWTQHPQLWEEVVDSDDPTREFLEQLNENYQPAPDEEDDRSKAEEEEAAREYELLLSTLRSSSPSDRQAEVSTK